MIINSELKDLEPQVDNSLKWMIEVFLSEVESSFK
jgi:hypothetical protein